MVLLIWIRDLFTSCEGNELFIIVLRLNICFMSRVDVEQLIRDGQVEHVLNNDHQG